MILKLTDEEAKRVGDALLVRVFRLSESAQIAGGDRGAAMVAEARRVEQIRNRIIEAATLQGVTIP